MVCLEKQQCLEAMLYIHKKYPINTLLSGGLCLTAMGSLVNVYEGSQTTHGHSQRYGN